MTAQVHFLQTRFAALVVTRTRSSSPKAAQVAILHLSQRQALILSQQLTSVSCLEQRKLIEHFSSEVRREQERDPPLRRLNFVRTNMLARLKSFQADHYAVGQELVLTRYRKLLFGLACPVRAIAVGESIHAALEDKH